MALSPDELAQIRDAVRSELQQERYGCFKTLGWVLIATFLSVLLLHVVVIGGFTIWHLLYPSH